MNLYELIADYEERFGELPFTWIYFDDDEKEALSEAMRGALAGRRAEIKAAEFADDENRGELT